MIVGWNDDDDEEREKQGSGYKMTRESQSVLIDGESWKEESKRKGDDMMR